MLVHHHLEEPVVADSRRDFGDMTTIRACGGIILALVPKVTNANPLLARSESRCCRLMFGVGIRITLTALGATPTPPSLAPFLRAGITTTTTDATTSSASTGPAWRIAHASLVVRPPALSRHSHFRLPRDLFSARGVCDEGLGIALVARLLDDGVNQV